MSPYEKELARLCYNHFTSTGFKNFTYHAYDGNDMINATNTLEAWEEDGYISNLIDNGCSFSFIIEDSLICYLNQSES